MGKLKNWLFEEKENQKIKKDNLLILILAGILLLVICIPVSDTKKNTQGTELTVPNKKVQGTASENTDTQNAISVSQGTTQDYVNQMEKKLESILYYMEGTGKVKVMVTIKSSGEQIVEKDIPNNRSNSVENDSQGGTRSVSEMENGESTVYLTTTQGDKIPYVIRQTEPVIDGVTVVAEGGGNVECCKNITEVIQALFGIEAHKIKVVKMKN